MDNRLPQLTFRAGSKRLGWEILFGGKGRFCARGFVDLRAVAKTHSIVDPDRLLPCATRTRPRHRTRTFNNSCQRPDLEPRSTELESDERMRIYTQADEREIKMRMLTTKVRKSASNDEEEAGVFAFCQALQALNWLLEVAENIPVSVDNVLDVTFQLQEVLEKEAESRCLSTRRMAAFEEHVRMVSMFVDAAEEKILDCACVKALQEVVGDLLAMEDVKRAAEQWG